MKRLNRADLITLDRPFSLFVKPGDVNDDGELEWYAYIVGYELDNIVYATGPLKAVVEAISLLNSLTGKCTVQQPDHNFVIKTVLEGNAAWQCGRCGEVAAESQLEET